jgi:hypothetical protein
MEERDLKHMQTERLVDLMEGIDISRSTSPIITLRDKTMEEGHHRDRHIEGPPIGPIYPHSWMNRHNQTTKMKLRTISINMSRNITH